MAEPLPRISDDLDAHADLSAASAHLRTALAALRDARTRLSAHDPVTRRRLGEIADRIDQIAEGLEGAVGERAGRIAQGVKGSTQAVGPQGDATR